MEIDHGHSVVEKQYLDSPIDNRNHTKSGDATASGDIFRCSDLSDWISEDDRRSSDSENSHRQKHLFQIEAVSQDDGSRFILSVIQTTMLSELEILYG